MDQIHDLYCNINLNENGKTSKINLWLITHGKTKYNIEIKICCDTLENIDYLLNTLLDKSPISNQIVIYFNNYEKCDICISEIIKKIKIKYVIFNYRVYSHENQEVTNIIDNYFKDDICHLVKGISVSGFSNEDTKFIITDFLFKKFPNVNNLKISFDDKSYIYYLIHYNNIIECDIIEESEYFPIIKKLCDYNKSIKKDTLLYKCIEKIKLMDNIDTYYRELIENENQKHIHSKFRLLNNIEI